MSVPLLAADDQPTPSVAARWVVERRGRSASPTPVAGLAAALGLILVWLLGMPSGGLPQGPELQPTATATLGAAHAVPAPRVPSDHEAAEQRPGDQPAEVTESDPDERPETAAFLPAGARFGGSTRGLAGGTDVARGDGARRWSRRSRAPPHRPNR